MSHTRGEAAFLISLLFYLITSDRFFHVFWNTHLEFLRIPRVAACSAAWLAEGRNSEGCSGAVKFLY